MCCLGTQCWTPQGSFCSLTILPPISHVHILESRNLTSECSTWLLLFFLLGEGNLFTTESPGYTLGFLSQSPSRLLLLWPIWTQHLGLFLRLLALEYFSGVDLDNCVHQQQLAHLWSLTELTPDGTQTNTEQHITSSDFWVNWNQSS